MHEDAIAAVAEEERHRLIHSVGLRSLRVGNRQVYLLPHLVKFRETLATSVDAFSWSKCEYGVDASRVVATSLYKGKRQKFYLTRVVVDY